MSTSMVAWYQVCAAGLRAPARGEPWATPCCGRRSRTAALRRCRCGAWRRGWGAACRPAWSPSSRSSGTRGCGSEGGRSAPSPLWRQCWKERTDNEDLKACIEKRKLWIELTNTASLCVWSNTCSTPCWSLVSTWSPGLLLSRYLSDLQHIPQQNRPCRKISQPEKNFSTESV